MRCGWLWVVGVSGGRRLGLNQFQRWYAAGCVGDKAALRTQTKEDAPKHTTHTATLPTVCDSSTPHTENHPGRVSSCSPGANCASDTAQPAQPAGCASVSLWGWRAPAPDPAPLVGASMGVASTSPVGVTSRAMC